MKKEEVLFYIANGKFYVYLVHAKKEVIEKIDTSSFFKCGEISDVENCQNAIADFVDKKFVLTGFLKPDIKVLYNDTTFCDLKELYKISLLPFNYDDISFIGWNSILKRFHNRERLVVFDCDYYTILKDNIKVQNIDMLKFSPIIIGSKCRDYVHYADLDILWNTFKSRFTNR